MNNANETRTAARAVLYSEDSMFQRTEDGSIVRSGRRNRSPLVVFGLVTLAGIGWVVVGLLKGSMPIRFAVLIIALVAMFCVIPIVYIVRQRSTPILRFDASARVLRIEKDAETIEVPFASISRLVTTYSQVSDKQGDSHWFVIDAGFDDGGSVHLGTVTSWHAPSGEKQAAKIVSWIAELTGASTELIDDSVSMRRAGAG